MNLSSNSNQQDTIAVNNEKIKHLSFKNDFN